jgi:hypothetical protein
VSQPEPVVERIMQAVRTRVAAYRPSYRSANVAKWQPQDNVIHVYQGDINENPEIDCPGNPPAKGYTLEAVIAAILKPSERDNTPIDTYKNRAWSEITKAITNANLWHNWGGLAINSNIGQIEDFTGEDGSGSGVMVRLSIHFRVDENDPTVARS